MRLVKSASLGAVILTMCLQGSLAAETVISPQDYVRRLGVGMDVDWAKTRRGKDAFDAAVAIDFKRRGLSHVRIRVKDALSDELLRHLSKVVDASLNAGLLAIIAYQANEFKNSPGASERAEVVRWWSGVARQFASYDARLAFNILIEPTKAVNQDSGPLNQLYEEAVAEIRKSNPTRNIFVAPRLRSDPTYLSELKWPSAHNGHVAAEWHFYASGPARDNPRKPWTTGTSEERAVIEAKIATALRWQQATGRVSWVGAWMPGDYNKANSYSVAEQVGFAGFVACALKKAGIPYAVNADNKFHDRKAGRWIEEMAPVLDAVIAPANCR